MVSPADPDELHRAILELYKDPERRELMANAARSRATVFEVENMIEGYERIYSDILAEAQV